MLRLLRTQSTVRQYLKASRVSSESVCLPAIDQFLSSERLAKARNQSGFEFRVENLKAPKLSQSSASLLSSTSAVSPLSTLGVILGLWCLTKKYVLTKASTTRTAVLSWK